MACTVQCYIQTRTEFKAALLEVKMYNIPLCHVQKASCKLYKNLPPYSAMAIAQCMPPRKEQILAPYATCNKAAFCTSSAGNSGKLAAIGGDSAMKGMTPANRADNSEIPILH